VRERFVKKKTISKSLERENERKSVYICRLITRRCMAPTALSAAAPQRKLREANEDGIERKDGMHDTKQSSRRNKSLVNMDQRTRLWFRSWL